MPLPDSASLRRVGLAWYQEPTNVPDACRNPPTRSIAGGVSWSLFDRACLLAITGKEPGDRFTQSDYEKVLEWGSENVRREDIKNLDIFIQMAGEAAETATGLIGRTFGDIPSSGISYDPGKTIDEAVEGITNPFGIDIFREVLPFGALVLGLGMIAIGGMRIL